MDDLKKRIAALSPQQRALLELRLKQQGEEIKTVSKQTIKLRENSEDLPLSLAQERLWFLHQIQPNIPLYNESSLLRLEGSLKIPVLEKSLTTLIERHESLRTRFILSGERPIQVIESAPKFTLPLIKLNAISDDDLNKIIKKEASIPFELTQAPLLQARLFQKQDREFILLLIMHHIISDGWSWKVFYQELATLYRAYSQGKSPSLSLLPIQYADFALWQQDWLKSEKIQSQLVYWKQQLADSPPVLNLPTDYPRSAIQRFQGAREPLTLSRSLTDSLKALSSQFGTTVFTVLLAAFDVLLYRYTQQTDIAVGMPFANRNRPDIEGLIGCFINTLVVRSHLSGEMGFEELLAQVRETTLAAYSHSDLPFEQLVKDLQPDRLMSHTPLFQVMFVYQDAPLQALSLPEITLKPLVPDSGTAKFDITLFIEDNPSGLLGALEYNTDLFKPDTIKRFLGHFQTLLEGIVQDPSQSLAKLPLLTSAETQQLASWNQTQVAYPHNVCLHSLVEAQVETTPDAVAVIADSKTSLTYSELNHKANQLAHYLQQLGIQPNSLVGVCCDRSLEMVIALLAILKAGGAYLPLDPTYPPERLVFVIEDAEIPVVLTQGQWLESLPDSAAKVIDLDREDIWQTASTNPVSSVKAEDFAYTIYTSGSTGTPKGAMNTHQAIVNRLLWMQEAYQVGENDRILQKTPFSFDVSVWEFFLPLISGAPLILARPEGHKDPVYLQTIIQDRNITMVHFVPSMLQVFLATDTLPALPNLKRVICSGEVLSVHLQNRFLQCFPHVELHNLYGPTEAAIDVTAWACHPQPEDNTVPIGKPIANTQIYLLDRHQNPVPVGVPGELHIGGVGLAKGYLNRSDLTAEKFIPHPFDPGQRLYKTGDLARYRADGAIEFLGRLDYQIKLRGFRIELGEIEAVLTQQSGVREAVVTVVEDARGDRNLTAYIVLDSPQLTIQALRYYLQGRLPDYMIPGVFMVLDALPLTPSGKVNRQALPKPDRTRLTPKTFVSPPTPIEEILVGIWQRILNLDAIGVADNFFELGGHSLLATQVISQIQQTFGVTFPLQTLFATPTIAELANQVEKALAEGKTSQLPPIQPTSEGGSLPLSFAQQRLWFLDRLTPDTAAYNGCVALTWQGPLNLSALEQSLNTIIERHAVLRTQITMVEGQPVQEIMPHLSLTIPVTDLEGMSPSQQQAKAQALATGAARLPFDLSQAPLLRVQLTRFGEQQYQLLFVLHHIIFDAWSAGILIREVKHLYEEFCQNHPPSLPPLPIQYADFAVWQRQWLQGEVLQQQLAYWKGQVTPLPPVLRLPTNPVKEVSEAGTRYHFSLSKELSDALEQLSRDRRITLFMTLLAGLNVLLHYYTKQTDIVVGSPIANRNRKEIEGLIGFFVNTLILRSNLAKTVTFEDILQQVQAVTLGAYTHQDLPFDKLMSDLQLERKLECSPLFRVWFVLQNTPTESLYLPGVNLTLVDLETGAVRHDLKLDLTETREGIQGFFEYKSELFEEDMIASMTDSLTILLTTVTEQPNVSLASLIQTLETTAKQQQLTKAKAVKKNRDRKLSQLRRKNHPL